MRAGFLRRRINVDQPVTSQNSIGEEIITWTEVDTVWAAVEPLRGREQLIASQIDADITTKITMRWSPMVDQITAKWRLRYKDTVYNIKAPPMHIELGQREVQMLCASGLNLG